MMGQDAVSDIIKENTSGDGNTVVISGMSGLYPKCRYIKDLDNVLYNKINPVTSDELRWECDHPEVARYIGNVHDLDRFDAQFFKVNYRLARVMDSMSRKLLEETYGAIYDAGVNPAHLSGKKVGVYCGTCFSETEKAVFYNANLHSGLGIAGCSKTMFANRISYWLNTKGPSISIDVACCSSTAALEQAYEAITRGECEAAIVGGANLTLHPQSLLHYGRMTTFSMDGKTKSFCEDATGCAKSEAINVLFLQKAKDALRIYADVVKVKTEYVSVVSGKTGANYGFYRNPSDTINFLNSFYDSINVLPHEVEYVEAFGSAIPEADKSELESIDRVFCKNRNKSLLVGSVMSNIGYSEAASGILAVTKVLLGYHKGQLAGNLHCNTPRRDVQGLKEGRLRILTDHHPFERKYAAVNNMSVTGVNAHVLLNGRYKPRDTNRYKSDIPHLVTISARQESSVDTVIKQLKSEPIDPEALALLQNIHETKVAGHLGRGFVILDTNEDNKTVSLSECSDYCDDTQRPLWFVYSGMGSQWAGMATQLMRIPTFAASIQRCHQVLKPKGLDIFHILTSSDKTAFDNILHSFVGIAAIQIGLTDVMNEIGIVPEKIIGHSVGELGCAYADGCFTAEEMILAAYSRGLVSLETPLIQGSMAAVGIGYQQILKMCPPDIEVACHNSTESCTISGPKESVHSFLAYLTEKEIFAKEVPCSNIAYHSRYIADAGPGLLKYLKEVIQSPKARSERWVSTSVPQDKWQEENAKYSSAEYHTNNLLRPVLFEETCKLIPSNAVLIEIAPHGLLQAILKRSLPQSCTNIPLTRRGHPDNVILVLEAIGKLYMEGFYPKVSALYPKIEYPVSTGTPFLSHLVEWAHEEIWPLPLYQTANRTSTATCNFRLSLYDEEYKCFKGHVMRNKILVPFSFVLVAVWDTLCMLLKVEKKLLDVQFYDLQFYAQPVIIDQRTVQLTVSLQRGSGRFEVINKNSKVGGYIATGVIKHERKITLVNISTEIDEDIPKEEKEVSKEDETINNADGINTKEQDAISENNVINKTVAIENYELSTSDVYRLFNAREYAYSEEFRSIYNANVDITEANISWNGNWVTFIDGLFQLNILKYTRTCRSISQPLRIRKLTIDVQEHMENIQISNMYNNSTLLKAKLCPIQDRCRCGGVLIDSMTFRDLLKTNCNEDKVILRETKFISTCLPKTVTNGNGFYSSSRDKSEIANNITLQCQEIGNLNSLQWVQAPEPVASKFRVKVHFLGLNIKDVNHALGINKYEVLKGSNFAMEYSGVTQGGQKIMGLVPYGAASRYISANPDLMWPLPSYWTLEEAATVPLAYVCAYYCLYIKSKFLISLDSVKQVSILVNGGAGALGQAVITLALEKDFRIFVTVNDSSKKQFLLKLFPQLKAENIGYSQDESFYDFVLNATKGKGCNYVICCNKGKFKNILLKCCSRSGVVFDTSLIVNRENFSLPMYFLNKEKAYVLMDPNTIISNSSSEEFKKISLLISDGIARGVVRPLSRVVYDLNETSRAFQLLATNRHRGRVLLRMQDSLVLTQHRCILSENSCHIVFCDKHPLGLQLADKLIDRGVKKLHLHFNILPLYLKYKLSVWNYLGIQITVSSGILDKISDITALLEKANRSGPVEGVYLSAGDILNNKILKCLYIASKVYCRTLKYFLVINKDCDDSDVFNDLVSSNNNGLSITYLNISMLKTFQDADDFNWYCGAVEAIEQALKNPKPVLHATLKHSPRQSLAYQISTITGLNINEDTRTNASLAELGMTMEKTKPLTLYLADIYHTYLDQQDILSLTLEQLQEIENRNTVPDFKKVNGMEVFYSYVDPDELLATSDMVFLPTLSRCSGARDDEFDLGEAFLCIIPGLEGHHRRFGTFCERLKMSALVLQPGLDWPEETPHELAVRYSKVLFKKTCIKKSFYILGYETGVFTALELANILQKHGQTGTVFCLGDGPEEIKDWLKHELSPFDSEVSLQIAVIRHLFTLMTRDVKAPDEITLRNCSSWCERLNICVQHLLGNVSHSAQYTRTLLEAAYTRLMTAINYEAAPFMLRSKLVLLRALHSSNDIEKCSLQNYTQESIDIKDLSLPIPHVTDDLQIAAIINSYLDEETLQAYEKKNLCESYILNAIIRI